MNSQSVFFCPVKPPHALGVTCFKSTDRKFLSLSHSMSTAASASENFILSLTLMGVVDAAVVMFGRVFFFQRYDPFGVLMRLFPNCCWSTHLQVLLEQHEKSPLAASFPAHPSMGTHGIDGTVHFPSVIFSASNLQSGPFFHPSFAMSPFLSFFDHLDHSEGPDRVGSYCSLHFCGSTS